MSLLIACTALEPAAPQAVVDIQASLDQVSPETRALVNFPERIQYGIFTCISADNVPAPATNYEQFKPSIWNAQADGYGTGWTYKNVASYATGELYSTGGNSFILFGRNDSQTADLYAYAPWSLAAYTSGPTAIPFTRDKDLMYATENTVRANHNLNPASGSPLNASFSFRRVMARIVFRFRLLNDNTTMGITLASVKNNHPAGGTAVLYTSGKFNIIDGSLNDLQSADVLSNVGSCTAYYTADPAVYDSRSAIAVNIVPTAISEDGELTFSFTSGGFTLPTLLLQKEWIKHNDGVTYGFQAGYTYTFYFTLDNYVRFDGFNIQEWGVMEDTLIHGVI